MCSHYYFVSLVWPFPSHWQIDPLWLWLWLWLWLFHVVAIFVAAKGRDDTDRGACRDG